MKIKLTATFLLIQSMLLQAQTPSRFPIDPTAKWNLSEITFSPEEDGQVIREKYEYMIQGDTTINSVQYHKLFRSGIAWYEAPFYYANIYSGAIRDDDNKLYLVRKDQKSEILLIDFNLGIGDTIKGEIGKGSIINETDTLTNGRKVISVVPEFCGGCCSTIRLLEGIGHSGGIMEEPPCFHIGFYGHYLNCFTINGESVYENEMGMVDCSDFFSSTEGINAAPLMKVYPIPFSDKLWLEMPDIPDNQATVSVFDITGTQLLSASLKTTKTELDLRHLKEGLYLVKLSRNGLYTVRKIVKE